jgi:hypothetical protein
MCGAKLEAVRAFLIDDEDPLDLEAAFEGQSRVQEEPASALRERDRKREFARDSVGGKRAARRTASVSSVSVASFPPDTVQEEETVEERSEPPQRVSGIGGPSLLGLNYDSSNTGFVYDTPRKDGFIYDTDEQSPQYLLEEVPRGISWRAWALMLLLLAGAGLGYMQWRANGSPQIDSLLARNGATIDPNHPVVTPETAKPAAQKPANPPADTSNNANAKEASAPDANSAQAKPDSDSADDESVAASTTSSNSEKEDDSKRAASPETKQAAGASAESKDADNQAADTEDNDNADPSDMTSAAGAATPKLAKKQRAAEKTVQPKSLGDKDPLIIQAEKYIQGRGVRQNCSTGVNLLRQAVREGNPEADVKLGALYWSGTCVTQSNVTAYEWFSRAHSLDPQNRWIERSRNSLWASMSPQDRRKVSD